MNDENLHITPDPEKGFPEPGIPVDQAWKEMDGMLNTEMPVSPADNGSMHGPGATRGIRGFFSNNWNIILVVVGVTTAITWGLVHFTQKTGPSVNVNDTVIQMKPAPAKLQSQESQPPSLVAANSKKSGLISPGTRNANSSLPKAIGDIKRKNASSGGSSLQPVNKQTLPGTITPGDLSASDKTASNNISQTDDNKLNEPKKTFSDSSGITGTVPLDTSGNNFLPAKPVDQTGAPGMTTNNGSSGFGENLTWTIGIHAQSGAVVQQHRTPNLFYGARVTGGLWHKKLKGGIETGLGWVNYNDYGSITQNITITDSIPGDSMHPVTHHDSSCLTTINYHYQYLQVPLFLSKQILSKNKFSLDLQTGVIAGFLISQSKSANTAVIPPNSKINETIFNDYTRRKTIWQWHIMVRFNWNLNKRLSLFISPSAIFYLNNLYDKNNKPPKPPWGIGLDGGVMYRFR